MTEIQYNDIYKLEALHIVQLLDWTSRQKEVAINFEIKHFNRYRGQTPRMFPEILKTSHFPRRIFFSAEKNP